MHERDATGMQNTTERSTFMRIIHDFAPASDNPRNSEGCFYRRPDGNIGFIYSRFLNGKEDFSCSDLYEEVLTPDGNALIHGMGRTLFTTEQFGAQNIMCPTVLSLPDGRTAIIFLVRMGPGHINPWMFESFDGGMTYQNGREIAGGDRYVGSENERAVFTEDGSILLWTYYMKKKEGAYAGIEPHAYSMLVSSRDLGKTWEESRLYDLEDKYGLQEPGCVQLKDGSLLAWARTAKGCQYLSRSFDGGRTFEEFKPCETFTSPLSPMSVKMLPDGRLFAVYNPFAPAPEVLAANPLAMWQRRAPLVYRTSKDGYAWSEPVTLEPWSETTNYCYTAIFPEKDFVLLGYCASDMVKDGGNLSRLRISRLEMSEIHND